MAGKQPPRRPSPPPPPRKPPPSRHTTPPAATLASKVLSGAVKPTAAQSRTLAASVLSQDAPKKK